MRGPMRVKLFIWRQPAQSLRFCGSRLLLSEGGLLYAASKLARVRARGLQAPVGRVPACRQAGRDPAARTYDALDKIASFSCSRFSRIRDAAMGSFGVWKTTAGP